MVRGPLLRSLRTCTQHHDVLTPQLGPSFTVLSRHVVQQARSLADAQPDHKPAETDASASEVRSRTAAVLQANVHLQILSLMCCRMACVQSR